MDVTNNECIETDILMTVPEGGQTYIDVPLPLDLAATYGKAIHKLEVHAMNAFHSRATIVPRNHICESSRRQSWLDAHNPHPMSILTHSYSYRIELELLERLQESTL